MLDAFYRQMFRGDMAPPSAALSALVASLVVLVMTFNAGSSLQLSAGGLSPLLVLFVVGGALGLFWFAAALFTLTCLFGGESDFQSVLRSILVGLWPLMFSGVALSAQQTSQAFGALFAFAVTIGTFVTLGRSLAAAQSISIWLALTTIILTLAFSVLAVGGLLLWPFMLLVGL